MFISLAFSNIYKKSRVRNLKIIWFFKFLFSDLAYKHWNLARWQKIIICWFGALIATIKTLILRHNVQFKALPQPDHREGNQQKMFSSAAHLLLVFTQSDPFPQPESSPAATVNAGGRQASSLPQPASDACWSSHALAWSSRLGCELRHGVPAALLYSSDARSPLLEKWNQILTLFLEITFHLYQRGWGEGMKFEHG